MPRKKKIIEVKQINIGDIVKIKEGTRTFYGNLLLNEYELSKEYKIINILEVNLHKYAVLANDIYGNNTLQINVNDLYIA